MATMEMEPVMFWATMAQFAICSVGFVMNGFLVYTILRNKNLRFSCCSICILMVAMCDGLLELSLITVPTGVALAGTQISQLACFFLISYGPSAQMSMIVILFLMSLDRLISILFPIWYKWFSHSHKWKYMITIVFFPSLMASSLFMVTAFLYTMDNEKIAVFCQPTDLTGPTAIFISNFVFLFLYIGTFTVYLAIWMLIKCQVIKMTQEKTERRLFRSLFVLMFITFFLWLPLPVTTVVILPNIQISANAVNIAYRAAAQFNKIAQTLNGPVLYFCSSDYKKAMRKEFFRIFWHKEEQNTQSNQRHQQQDQQPLPQHWAYAVQLNNFVPSSSN